MQLASKFLEIAHIVRTSTDPQDCWRVVLDSVGMLGHPNLAKCDADNDVSNLVRQLELVWTKEPIPPDLTFLYFGIFEALDRGAKRSAPRAYIAGGSGPDPERQLREGALSYFPKSRFLSSSLLRAVGHAAHSNEGQRQTFEYLLPFGALSLVVRFAVISCAIAQPTFVGFDSDDFARIAN